MQTLRTAMLIGGATLGLAGCVVGPNYAGPPATAAAADKAFKRAAAGTTAVKPAARWWTALHDPKLDHLVEAALTDSPSVDAARAKVREARALLRGQWADGLPTTGISAAYLRTRNVTSLLSGASGGGPSSSGGGPSSSGSGSSSSGGGADGDSGALNLYATGFDASWEIDLFGAHRRAVQGAAAALQASQASLADAFVSLTAEVAQAYIQLCDARQRLQLTQRNIDIEARILALMRIRRSGGTASDLDVVRVGNQLDSTRATVAPLQALLTEQLDRLALLTGQAPGALDEELAAAAAVPAPPATVAIGDPAAMLQRRPDIVAAERKLAQQTAAVGQSVAAQFPTVRLLGDVGFAALSPETLFNGSNFTYLIAPVLQWTPWDFGRNRARIAQANAARDEAEANYRQAVLAALEDAETSLARYGQQRNAVADLGRVRESAERAYALTEIRLRGGTAATTDVLDADTRRVQAELNYQQALAQLSQYYVALQKSLGLGWVSPAG